MDSKFWLLAGTPLSILNVHP